MPEHEPVSQFEADPTIRFENQPNVDELMIPDERGLRHEAYLVNPIGQHPEQEHDGKLPLVLIIGGIPRGAENDKDQSPFTSAFKHDADKLARRGIPSLVMNPAGMGESEGDTWQESLASRIGSWESALDYFRDKPTVDPSRIRIIGNSMGGHIGLQLVDHAKANDLTVDRLVLLSPFFYSERAEQQKFGPNFTQAIHDQVEAGDFESSPAVADFRKYPGQVMLTYVRQDEPPIPQGMQDLGNDILQQAIAENRGVGIGLDRVKHNLRPVDQSAMAMLDSIKTIDEASDEIVGFLAKAD